MTAVPVPPAPDYACPGRAMPQPKGAPFEGYVACYRAGHRCPPKVAITTENETHRMTTWRCPCCGDYGPSYCRPKEWDALISERAQHMTPVSAEVRVGVVTTDRTETGDR